LKFAMCPNPTQTHSNRKYLRGDLFVFHNSWTRQLLSLQCFPTNWNFFVPLKDGRVVREINFWGTAKWSKFGGPPFWKKFPRFLCTTITLTFTKIFCQISGRMCSSLRRYAPFYSQIYGHSHPSSIRVYWIRLYSYANFDVDFRFFSYFYPRSKQVFEKMRFEKKFRNEFRPPKIFLL